MQRILLTSTVLFMPLWLATPALAENYEQTRQLLATKQCAKCDLSGAGLAFAKLASADLQNADLSGANLSRVNLTGANLSGANLSGATLAGANLSGANLSGANLTGVDLTGAFIVNINLSNANIAGTNFRKAIGIPKTVGQAPEFFRWGVEESRKGNQGEAIINYSQAIEVDGKFAPAYFARGISRYKLGDTTGAIQDAEVASELFKTQGSTDDYKASQEFIKAMKEPPKEAGDGGGNFMGFLGSLTTLLFRFLL